ncbi:MAG: CDP-6-deoxy-delta-3,4-glucoseen reductase [Burkholderiaceae bacterium]|nr:CDP-6-deoxy-delta-3,4-glucoseen reductase [Sulfuritalea sp.]MCF8174800.1 CDP-6-deoxy-delta-3,4-glucoseen reductase [Burkholderiaceae bacterium]
MAPVVPFRITLRPSGHEFNADGSDSILQAALDAGLTLPYGCRNGACGSCKGRVIDGLVDHGIAQDQALSTADRASGLTLFCCAKPLTDLVLECREVGTAKDIPVKIMPCRVQKLERVADDVIVLSLKLPANERLQFLAGQYIEFLLKDGKRRAFSIANAPHDDGFLQLHVRLIGGGEFTQHVFTAMKEKDILRFQGPYGSFYLREESTKPIILLAGGTGFAPIKALVEHAIHNRISRPMEIYWGARNPGGLYLPDLPSSWAAAHSHIRYIPVLSDAASFDAWQGRTGLVHHAVLEDHGDLATHQVYACGAPAMIDTARCDFAAHGLPADEFFADAFTFASTQGNPPSG